MLLHNFIRYNVLSSAIILYIFLFTVIMFIRPNFIFDKDGSLRQFGIGRERKTVIPAWLLAIMMAILSYFFVLYYSVVV